jgi:hypothetical protein
VNDDVVIETATVRAQTGLDERDIRCVLTQGEGDDCRHVFQATGRYRAIPVLDQTRI